MNLGIAFSPLVSAQILWAAAAACAVLSLLLLISRSRGAACLITRKAPVRQTSTTERKSSTARSVISPTPL